MVTENQPVDRFELVGGDVCLDFVNTGSQRREGPFFERLTSYDDLLVWADRVGVVSAEERSAMRELAAADRPGAEAVLARARALREAIYRVFTALTRDDRPVVADLELISREQAESAAHRCLTCVAETVEFCWESEPNLARPLWPVAQAAADLLVSDQRMRVKECGTENCNWLFLDASKNKSRRWCEMKECGNRAKARRHYARRRGQG